MPDYVELLGGLTVPVDAFNVVHEFDRRGLILKQQGELLRISNADGSKPDLSAGDVERIKRWKPHMLALMNYVAPERTW